MKKKGLLIAALTLAMSAAAAVTASAAGWSMENGSWVYLDSNGDKVYNEWRRGADNQWRYLDGYGQMALSTWVDDEYYVDANGIMVTGGWQQLDVTPDGDTADTHWYYFQDNGKIVTDKWMKISGKWYHFDPDGVMETGWVDEDMYFCNDDGAALTGWQQLYPPEDEDIWTDPFDDSDGKVWYYFNTSGKKYVPVDGRDYTEKRIDGTYYCFDNTGIMQTGWVLYDPSKPGIAGYRYYGNSGACVTGWYTAEPPESLASNYENAVDWFYFSKNGEPKVGPAQGTATYADLVRINGKAYLFNDKGNPVYGLQRVQESNGEYTAYYFNEDDRMVAKGRIKVEESDGMTSTFYFASSGRGYTGVYSGSLYYMGKLQTATEGMRYEPVQVDGKSYLVNESGRVTKSTSGVKDADGVKYATDKSGVVIKINDEEVGSVGRAAVEPIWWY